MPWNARDCDCPVQKQSLTNKTATRPFWPLNSTGRKWIVSFPEKGKPLCVQPPSSQWTLLHPATVFGARVWAKVVNNGKSPQWVWFHTRFHCPQSKCWEENVAAKWREMCHCKRSIFSHCAAIMVYLWPFHPAQHQGERIWSCPVLKATHARRRTYHGKHRNAVTRLQYIVPLTR